MDVERPLWTTYQPRLLTMFRQTSQYRHTNNHDLKTLMNGITIPGRASIFKEPTLPVRIPNADPKANRKVCKRPLLACIIIAESVDVPVLPRSINVANAPITFFCARNSLRTILGCRGNTWRVDLQRMGRTVFIRRHLDHHFENMTDIGYSFETLCMRDAVKRDMEFHGLLQSPVGEFSLIVSTEIDSTLPRLRNA